MTRPGQTRPAQTASIEPKVIAVERAADERAAVVALLRETQLPLSARLEQLRQASSAGELLARELVSHEGQLTLEPPDPAAALRGARQAIAEWERAGIRVRSVRDADYPENLALVHDRPPLLFVRGSLAARDARSVAVIGTRDPSGAGLAVATTFARDLGRAGFTVVSGLAAGIDTAVHEAALDAGVRTLAVIGSGLHHSYPRQNAALQARLGREGGVVSPFWPESPPSPEGFRRRNAVMSGLTRGIVVIEGGMRSGTRLATRLALAQGRPVFLWRGLRDERWARDLAAQPAVSFVQEPAEVGEALDALWATGDLED